MGATATAQPSHVSQTAKRSITRDLCETNQLAFGALAQGQSRVDRANKIIRRVKMVAAESKNVHDVEGVEGTDYLYEALERVRGQYEGTSAFSNHPPRNDPDQERRNEDLLGVYRDVEVTRYQPNPQLGEVYGDLHLVTHPLTEALLDAAEKDTLSGAFMCSHNARGDGDVRGRRYAVSNISKVRSCDVVTRGAGTRNFFESHPGGNPVGKIKLAQIVLKAKSAPARLRRVLMEDDGMMDMDVPAEAPAGADDWKACVTDAISKLLQSDDATQHAIASKLMAIIHPDKVDQLEEADDEEGDDKEKKLSEDEEKKLEESLKGGSDDKAVSSNISKLVKEGFPQKQAVAIAMRKAGRSYTESQRGTGAIAANVLDETRELFKVAGLTESKALLEGAARIGPLKERIAFINELKATGAGKAGNKAPPGPPREQGQGQGMARELNESAAADKACEGLLSANLY